MPNRNAKETVHDSSTESGNSSEEESEPEYTVEKVVDKRMHKGKVSRWQNKKQLDCKIRHLFERN